MKRLFSILIVAVLVAGCGTTPLPESHLVTPGEAHFPTTAIRDPGEIYWTWFAKDEGETNVYLARRAGAADEPSEPVRVNTLPGNANIHAQAPAQVAVAPNGEVYVVWTNRIDVDGRRFPASNLLFARSTDNGRSFEPELVVNDDAGGEPAGHSFHDVIVAEDGTIYVSWIDTRRLDAYRRSSEAVHMDGHHHGGSTDGPGAEIRIARSEDGGRTFSPSIVVDGGACPCCRTALAARGGSLFVAWRKVFDGNVRDVVVSRSDDGGETFSTPVPVHRDGWKIDGCPHSGPAIAADRKGVLHVAWYTGAETQPGIYYSRSVDAAHSFAAPQPLATGLGVTIVRMASAEDDGVWFVWEQGRMVYLAHAIAGGRARVLDGAAREGRHPVVSAGRNAQVLSWSGPQGLEALRWNSGADLQALRADRDPDPPTARSI